MTSVLRRGGKDRSSFPFFKRQNIAADVPTNSLAHRLPDFSPIDTRSFAGLFDEYISNDHNDLSRPQQPQQTVSAPTLTSAPIASISTPVSVPVKAVDSKVDLLRVSLTRNDSTASSCYSQPSHRDSDFSPLVTRQSSSSSYTQEPFPELSRGTTKRQPNALTIPKRSSQTLANQLTESPISAPATPLRANSSLIRVVSVPPNLDKPLPPGPRRNALATKASFSTPDLLLHQQPAELPSELPTHLITSGPVQRAFSQPARMLSTKRGFDGEVKMEALSRSTQSIRDARAGKVGASGHYRNRSASDTEIPQYGWPMNDNSRWCTVDSMNLALTVPSSSRRSQATRKRHQRPITAAAAERVIYRIMCSVHTAQDLQAAAMVSKGFYRTFQRNESKLVSHLVFKSSRAAWELRRSTLALKGSNDFLLKDYRRDCRTLDALKALILAHCSATCKRSTLIGLLGQDEARTVQIDDALWRIWTFCSLFGNTVGQVEPPRTEIDWLQGSRAANNKHLGAGFAIGNGEGLTASQLEDMNEMWQFLQVLVSGFQGREEEAKRHGVFDNWHLRESTTESQHLAEWTSYLLALGPQTILTLSGCSFEQAKMLGLTKWPVPPAGQSRSSFLTSTLAQVYQERILEDATRRATQMSARRTSAQVGPPRAPSHRPTRSLDEQLTHMPSTSVQKMQTQSLRIDTTGVKRRPVSTMATQSTTNFRLDIQPDCDPTSGQMEIRPDCDPSWKTRSTPMLLTSPTADPTTYYSLSMTATASAKIGATLFPIDYASPAPRVPFPAPERSSAQVSEVVDPVDKAMNLLVRDLGFAETRARKALAMCDTGSGIDLQKAIQLLTIDSKDAKQKFSTPVELPTPGSIASPSRLRKLQPSKAYCEGHCKRTSTMSHSRNLSTGTIRTATDMSASPISAVGDSEWDDTISPLAMTPMSASRNSTLTRASSKAKAWKVLGLDDKPKRKNSVLRIEEYQAKVERRKSMRATSITEHSSPKIKDGLSKSLLGLGLGIGSNAGAKSAEDQLERARVDERRKKEKSNNNKTSCMPRYA
ncbi:hypothetical protein H2200_003792 [Cladophialophora chaetospira]|uniref:UBA domain-containing protein n=1 Tax=Cladophialophora chaetospira TaxID=386627 RepID=A0AA38XEV8_9EURO|nr:hypothetical protein H2200_003792 [Cladophialophora chaetospira]